METDGEEEAEVIPDCWDAIRREFGLPEWRYKLLALTDVGFALSDERTSKRLFHEVRHSTPWFERRGGIWDVWFGRRWNVVYTHGRMRSRYPVDLPSIQAPDAPDCFSIIDPRQDAEEAHELINDLMRDLHRCKKPKEPHP